MHRSQKKQASQALVIPENELVFSYSRSGGPGGQNVNKVATKVTLFWDFWRSAALSLEQKMLIQRDQILANRINKEGVVVLHEQQTRSQEKNRELVISKLHRLLETALTPKPERIETKIPKAKKQARLENKKHHSDLKQGRRHKPDQSD